MRPVFLKETVGQYQGGTYVWLSANTHTDHKTQQRVTNYYISNNRGIRGFTKVEPHQFEDPTVFVDVECRPVKVGDHICRFNTTDNIQILERREVVAVTAEALMLAPKTKGGRVTSTGDNSKVMIVSR